MKRQYSTTVLSTLFGAIAASISLLVAMPHTRISVDNNKDITCTSSDIDKMLCNTVESCVLLNQEEYTTRIRIDLPMSYHSVELPDAEIQRTIASDRPIESGIVPIFTNSELVILWPRPVNDGRSHVGIYWKNGVAYSYYGTTAGR
jgi:hypothetical protein